MHVPADVASIFRTQPIRLADIGARGGWQAKWREVSDHMVFVGFEPEQTEFERLCAVAAANEVYSDAALYRREDCIPFYHTRDPATSSIYRPNRALWQQLLPNTERLDIVRTDTLEARTLDEALRDVGLSGLDFIKLDTQGSELDILHGATETLAGDVFGIEVEVEFAELYEGQPLFPDVHAHLTGGGFDFVDFPEFVSVSDMRWWRTYGARKGLFGRAGRFLRRFMGARGPWRGANRLLYADAVFFRTPDAFLTGDGGEIRRRAFLAVFVSCVMRYYEYALDFVETACRLDRLSSEDGELLRGFTRRAARAPSTLVTDVGRVAHRVGRRLRGPPR